MKYPSLSWMVKSLKKLGFIFPQIRKFDDLIDTPNSKTGKMGRKLVVDENEQNLIYENIAYCGYTTNPNILLTTTFQKVIGWTELVAPVNTTHSNGTFKSLIDGIFEWHLERIYTNADNSPLMPITLALEVRKNGISVFNRELIIGAATNPSEPNASAFTSPFIFAISANDTFEFFVKASMGAVNPISTRLVRMQMTANKIHEIMN